MTGSGCAVCVVVNGVTGAVRNMVDAAKELEGALENNKDSRDNYDEVQAALSYVSSVKEQLEGWRARFVQMGLLEEGS